MSPVAPGGGVELRVLPTCMDVLALFPSCLCASVCWASNEKASNLLSLTHNFCRSNIFCLKGISSFRSPACASVTAT